MDCSSLPRQGAKSTHDALAVPLRAKGYGNRTTFTGTGAEPTKGALLVSSRGFFRSIQKRARPSQIVSAREELPSWLLDVALREAAGSGSTNSQSTNFRHMGSNWSIAQHGVFIRRECPDT